MGLCRVDVDRLRGLAARVGAKAVALQDVVPVAGLLALHGHDAAASTVSARLTSAGEWLCSWQRSLDERADLIHRMEHEAATPTLTTPGLWATSRLRAVVATHLGTPDVIADRRFEDVGGPAATLRRIVAAGGSPSAVAAFFAGLPAASAIRLAAHAPDLVGNLGGAPLGLRFLANGLRLEMALDRARRDAANAPAWSQPAAEREAAALQELVDRGPSLVLLDWPSGRVAEWVGPHDAPHVAILVPGTGVDVWSFAAFREQAARMVDHDPSGGGLAVVAALVYTPPPTIAHAALGGYADRGGLDLTRFVGGLDFTGRHLSLIGHSYGSTVVGEAVRVGTAAVLDDSTDIVVLGSPGIRFDHVTELPVPAERVWVGLIPGDEILLAVHPEALPEVLRCSAGMAPPIQACDTGEWLIHGRNPAHPSFGAQRFPAEPVAATIAHTAYFSLNAAGEPSQALANILAIATADYPGPASILAPDRSLSPDP